MRVLTLSMLIAAVLLSGVALVPCLKNLNWLAIPFSAATALLGALGLVIDRDPTTQHVRDPNTYIAALVAGIALAGWGVVSCFLGGGDV